MITQTETLPASTIEVENCGPIPRLTIQCPAGGGLVELRGDNDLGKSETIDAIDAAINNRGGIEVRRGCVAGSLTAFGVTVKIGKRLTRTGEAIVESLEGRFSIEDLIEPKLKDPIAADAKRIKTLIQIKGQPASASLFYPLLGSQSEFESHVSEAAVKSEDFVVMAERVKRDLESSARKLEDQAKHEDGHAQGVLGATIGVDLSGEDDADKLQGILEQAIRHESALKAKAEASAKAARQARFAQDSLDSASDSYDGPSVAEATVIEATAKQQEEDLRAEVATMEAALNAKKAEWTAARNDYSSAILKRKNAETHEATLKQWQEQIKASIPVAPNAETLLAASEAVAAARDAVGQGAIIARAKKAKAEADSHAAKATEFRQKAMRLRDAAKGTDDVLSSLISSPRFRVEGGRLMATTESTPKTYAELSHGKRSRIAIEEAIEAVGPGGVICLKQEFYEGIAPQRRRDIAEFVRGKNVLVLTAVATDDKEIKAVTV